MSARIPDQFPSAGAHVTHPPAHRPAADTQPLRRATIQYRAPAETLDRSRDHFALERRVSWWRRPAFWDGIALPLLGACCGAFITLPFAIALWSFWWTLALAAIGFWIGCWFR